MRRHPELGWIKSADDVMACVQGTQELLDAAEGACEQLFVAQNEALALPYPGVLPEGPAAHKAFGS